MDSFFVDLDEHFVSLSLRTVYYESSLRRVEPRAFVVVEYREAVHRYCLDRWLCFCFACRFCKRSGDSIAQAIRNGVSRASQTVRNLDWFEVESIRGHIADGEVGHFQVQMKLGFRIEQPES